MSYHTPCHLTKSKVYICLINLYIFSFKISCKAKNMLVGWTNFIFWGIWEMDFIHSKSLTKYYRVKLGRDKKGNLVAIKKYEKLTATI